MNQHNQGLESHLLSNARGDNGPLSNESDHSLDQARFLAEIDAANIAAKRNDDNANAALKKTSILPEIKQKLHESRKPRLRTIEQYLCDNCDSVIGDSTEGFIIHGNIYVADPTTLGGLIGNNFPEEGGNIEDVRKTVFCRKCFCKALGLGPKHDVSDELNNMINSKAKQEWIDQKRSYRR